MSQSVLKIKNPSDKQTSNNLTKSRILLISNMYPYKNQQLSSIFIKNIVKSLRENGFTILLAVKRGNTNNFIIKLYHYAKFFLVSILKGLFFKYDAIYVHYIAHSTIPLLIIKLFRKKVKIVSHTHGGDILEQPKIFGPITYKTLTISNIIISPSYYFKDVLINKYKIEPKKIKIFPSGGIDTNLFKPKKVNRKKILKNYTNQITLGFVSRIYKGKGWEIFLKAIKKLEKELKQPILGIIIGDGEEVNSMKRLIKKLQLYNTIQYLGGKSHNNLATFYNCFDIFIFPTKKPESLGLVGLEAMACGIPIIGSDIGGLTTYIKNGINGYTFTPYSIENLCEKINTYLSISKKKKNKMKKAARKTALKYERSKVSLDLIKIFERL